MSYFILNMVVLGMAALVAWPVLRRQRWGALTISAAILVVLTLVFDRIMIAADLYDYQHATLSGWWVAGAPIEDYAYAIVAVLLMPALWVWFRDDRDQPPSGWSDVLAIIKASRPFSWINTAYPFAAGYLLSTGGDLDAAFWVGTLFFLIPYNLVMYGVNDVFDYASDLANPRKGGIEGALVDPRDAGTVHRRILVACVIVSLPFVTWLLFSGSLAAALTLMVVLFFVVAYSAPGLRFKERPILDSMTSSAHFVGPLVYALAFTGTPLTGPMVWPVVVSFFIWGMCSQAFGAVQDVVADRQGGIASIATVLGARLTTRAATCGYLLASVVLLALPWPMAIAAALPVPYVIQTARFWNITDARCAEANRGWRTFLWLNLVTGFAVTMLLLWHALG